MPACDEVFHVRSDKIFADEKCVELIGKGGRVQKVQVLHGNILQELDLSQR
jgi:hypothetical protein